MSGLPSIVLANISTYEPASTTNGPCAIDWLLVPSFIIESERVNGSEIISCASNVTSDSWPPWLPSPSSPGCAKLSIIIYHLVFSLSSGTVQCHSPSPLNDSNVDSLCQIASLRYDCSFKYT